MKAFMTALAFISLISQAQADIKRIIGNDTRERITARTYRPEHESIGVLMVNLPSGLSMCTGTVVSPRHVITAAHCLTENRKYVDSVSFIPAMNGDLISSTRPFGTFYAVKVRIFKNYLISDSAKHDLGVITFSRELPVPSLPIGVIPKNDLAISIAGYPGDKTPGTLWEAHGNRNKGIFGVSANSHGVDTMGGQSGAAVRAIVNGEQAIVGIHSSGRNNYIFEDENLALFFTPQTLNLIHRWIAED